MGSAKCSHCCGLRTWVNLDRSLHHRLCATQLQVFWFGYNTTQIIRCQYIPLGTVERLQMKSQMVHFSKFSKLLSLLVGQYAGLTANRKILTDTGRSTMVSKNSPIGTLPPRLK